MRPFLLSSCLIAAIVPACARAQVKYPIFDEPKSEVQNVVYQEATERGDYRNGRLMRITLKDDGTPIQGVLVRTDSAKKVIYVRTQPGTPPRAIPVADIKRIEKGTIKQVSDRGDTVTPEIQQLVIYNGGQRRVAFTAPTLSPSERAVLAQMETTENHLAYVEYLAAIQDRVLENDVGIQTEQRLTRELSNQLLQQQLYVGANRPFYIGETQMQTANRPASGLAPALEAMTSLAFGQVSPVPFLRIGPTVFPKLPLAPDSLTQARREYLSAQSQGVFENGRLVAVVVPESTGKAATE